MLIDSHVHYSSHSFDGKFRFLYAQNGSYGVTEGKREKLLHKLKACGITAVIEPGVEYESNLELLNLSYQYRGFLYPAVGVHPTRTFLTKWKKRKNIDGFARYPTVVAIGETGLDYHHERSEQHRLCQKAWFRYQIRLAHRFQLPLILHIRQADADALRILKQNQKRLHGGVVHCFAGSWETAQEYLALGFHLGIGGMLLQSEEKSAPLEETVKRAPLERLLIETDAPYVLPDCEKLASRDAQDKTLNTSLILPQVVHRIAELKALDPKQVEQAILFNTVQLFRLRRR